MTNQATVRSTGTSISTNTSTNTLENASIVQTLFDLFHGDKDCHFALILSDGFYSFFDNFQTKMARILCDHSF